MNTGYAPLLTVGESMRPTYFARKMPPLKSDAVRVGWRFWGVTRHGGLISPYRFTKWPMRERLVSDVTPSSYWPCISGIYAFFEEERALQEFGLAVHRRNHTIKWAQLFATMALGQVSLWGRTVECDHGWQAQYAYPYSVQLPEKDLMKRVRDNYGIDVEHRWLTTKN